MKTQTNYCYNLKGTDFMKKVFSRVFIKDTAGDFLVIRDRADVWNFPGGKKEIGETTMECAIREVYEETALRVLQVEEVYQADFLFEEVKWEGHFYFAHQVSGRPTLNEPNKIKGVQFISELSSVEFSPSLASLFRWLSRQDNLKTEHTTWY